MKASVERHVVVPDADILIGVPCYKDGPMVARCLASLAEPGVQLLLVDNGSAADVKHAIFRKGIVIRNEVNRYVNPAWNQIMELFLAEHRYDLLVLANSDLVLDAGWAAKLRARSHAGVKAQVLFGIDAPRKRSTLGAFFAMTPRVVAACCPIPEDLLVMGGDDFIFHVARGIGSTEHVIEDLTMMHVERGTYDKSPEVWKIARRDTKRWRKDVLPKLVPRRIAKVLGRKL